MGLLPFKDGKLCVPERAAGGYSDNPTNNPIVQDILELGERKQDAAWAVWREAREERFGQFLRESLLGEMMAKLAAAPKSANTIKIYKQHFARFERFASECAFEGVRGMCALPASWPVVVDFLLADLQNGKSYMAIRQAAAGISAEHVSNSLPDPTQSLEVRAMVRLARENAGQFAPAEPAKPNGKANGKANGKGLEHEP